ncbi:hypothetical protein B0T22DRAFT_512996 [Podospora appendiculata]|uniref:Uncharacterized protein n=1 Tax=Podospora appendiculata TaxID=314037 RepID=A0AAE0XAF2_9PEZI|nr:hypothetical protein B0T22DRAFT_512996 [Podospora appendiculata]
MAAYFPLILDPDILVEFEFDFLMAACSAKANCHPEDKRAHFVVPFLYSGDISLQTTTLGREIPQLVEYVIRSRGLGFFPPGVESRPREQQLVTVVSVARRCGRQAHASDTGTDIKWLDPRYGWLAVTVRTRRMREFDLELGEIDAMCIGLRRFAKLQIDRTCGLRVAVTNSDGLGLDLLTLKKTMTLVFLLEDSLFRLCAPYRFLPRHGDDALRVPIMFGSNLARLSEDEQLSELQPENFAIDMDLFVPNWKSLPRGVQARLNKLWGARNPDALALLFVPCSRLSSSSFGPGAEKMSVSVKIVDYAAAIEFRMFESTLDPGLAKMWAEVCAALVRKGGQKRDEYRELLKKIPEAIMRREVIQPAEMLADLGVHETVIAD